MAQDPLSFYAVLEKYIPDLSDVVQSFMGNLGEFFVGGVLAAFLLWTIGFSVHAVFSWLNNWSKNEGEN